ncbi:hypothetical protein [Rossellomorea marisflavi]|uniref:hypothetical protein n=1 Tax=Rossellomorea marisflavi TaxID=189381 RepID=UPI00345DA2DF
MSQKVELDEKEYKKLSLHFRKVASRFLTTDFREADDNLARFLAFIDDSPIIKDFINKNNVVKYDMEEIVKSREYGQKFKLPVKDSEEIGFIYQLLSHVNETEGSIFSVSIGYNIGRKYQEASDRFNQLVVKPLVDHIVSYLGEMAIDMELDKKSTTQFNIGDFRGQLNHAEGQASISANQTYNETKVEELKEVAQKFAQALIEDKSIPDKEKEDTVELVEAAVQEVESEKPKKVIVRTAMDQVRAVNDVAGAGANVITFGTQLLQLFQGFIG